MSWCSCSCPTGPKTAKWLTAEERDLLVRRIEEDDARKTDLGQKAQPSATRSRMAASGRWRVVYFCGVVCFYAVNFWMPTIIQELGIDKKDFLKVGLLSMIPWGVAAVAMVLWGHHSDRTGERRWHSAAGCWSPWSGCCCWRSSAITPITVASSR